MHRKTSLKIVPFVGFLGVISGAFLSAACSSSSDATAPSADAGVDASPADLGKAIVVANACSSCHGADLAGSASGIPSYPGMNAPNITSDQDKGIGGWTDAQIKTALTKGTDDQDQDLCWVMPRFTFSAAQLDDVVAYLRTVPAVAKDIPDGECPGDGGVADAAHD